ncbi:MAG: recombinase family protein [Gemmatimonadetes bacterium]|nr:recombinase family protein [Gemmatimonadota bacterium]
MALRPRRGESRSRPGGNLDRPALKQLVADIEAGLVQRILIYKLDRLSRSLADFMRLAEVFEQHGASIVSVTQQFDTGTPMGRLTLNMLLSFGQFEREQTAERTRHKMGAARRKGKRTGGMPLLGYDIVDTKLVINEAEAQQVRAIFQLYLEHEAIMPVVQELNRRCCRTKSWTTKKGVVRHGKPFEKGCFVLHLEGVG